MERRLHIPARATPTYLLHYGTLDKQFVTDTERGARVEIGPTYHIASSRGVPLLVDQVVTVTTLSTGAEFKHYYFLAFDERNDEILGHKMGDYTVRWSDNRTPIQIEHGVTVTGVRGDGVATCLDLVFAFAIQHEANLLQRTFVWHAINANAALLREELIEGLRTRRIQGSIPLQQQLHILKREEEQQRWQHVWGNGGIMGMENGQRVFRSQKGFTQSLTSHVYLKREDPLPNGRVEVTVTKSE